MSYVVEFPDGRDRGRHVDQLIKRECDLPKRTDQVENANLDRQIDRALEANIDYEGNCSEQTSVCVSNVTNLVR